MDADFAAAVEARHSWLWWFPFNKRCSMKRLGSLIQVSALVAATALLTQPARAEKSVSMPFDLPMRINGVVTASGCQNSPGPKVTLGGTISCLLYTSDAADERSSV